MKQVLIPNKGGYNANLHAHTTDSDGKLTPEEACKYYKEHGYSILAITDHLFMRDRSSLNTKDFVCLSGFENNIIDWNPYAEFPKARNPLEVKCYHLNFYSPDPKKANLVGIVKYFYDFFTKHLSEEIKSQCHFATEFFPNEYSRELAQKAIDEGLAQGYLVQYNHPSWSNQTECDYLGLKGLTSMEMVNTGSFINGFAENNEYVYDLMLRDGQHICCTANDDNHNLDSNNDDSFYSFNIMFPKKLTYESVFECLKEGNLYCSTGPLFNEIYVENNIVYVSTKDDVAGIYMSTNGQYAKGVLRKEKPLLNAQFVLKDAVTYFRIKIKDKNGNHAYTRAYFRSEEGLWK